MNITDAKLLTAKTEDLFDLCEKYAEPKFSQFLDGGEIAVIEDDFRIPYGFNTMFFGGYERAERKIFGVFPEWQQARTEDFPLLAIRFEVPKFRRLTHRDYLGALMSLGIDRSKTGDILVDEEGAYVFAESDIAEYIARSVNKISTSGVKGRVIEPAVITVPPPRTVEKKCVCASLRLDAVLSAALGISRAAAETLIRGGSVKVNHRAASDRSKQVSENDLLSVRGSGRFILKETGNITGKGRLHITVEKFV